MKTGTANLPLHYGAAPRWLFNRMKKLAREIVVFMVSDLGPEEVLRRIADPFWFQAFGCVLGFDWHSSGVTTTTCAALKEGLKGVGEGLGLYVAGGKGGASRKTPEETSRHCDKLSLDPEPLVFASRMSAKVDSAAVQDGYSIYHHCFLFTQKGSWAVVQQGMNESSRMARRYHWLIDDLESFVCEPHKAVCCDMKGEALNLVARESAKAREVSTELSNEKPDKLVAELKRLQHLELPRRHQIMVRDINPDRLHKTLTKTYERSAEDFQTLLGLRGVGLKTLRALALIAELVHGAPVSFRDPARFSFAHGGKDGIPYPVDRETYDRSVDILRNSINHSRIERTEKDTALRRLAGFSRAGGDA